MSVEGVRWKHCLDLEVLIGAIPEFRLIGAERVAPTGSILLASFWGGPGTMVTEREFTRAPSGMRGVGSRQVGTCTDLAVLERLDLDSASAALVILTLPAALPEVKLPVVFESMSKGHGKEGNSRSNGARARACSAARGK